MAETHNQFKRIAWACFGLLIAMAIPLVLGWMGWEGFIVGFATVLLGFATFNLGFIEIKESRRERRRLRLKEQLEDLYSPLFGLGAREFLEFSCHRQADHRVHKKMEELQSRYKYLATNELRELLDIYYQTDIGPLSHDKQLWNNFIRPIWNHIVSDFENRSDEYNDLTGPVS